MSLTSIHGFSCLYGNPIRRLAQRAPGPVTSRAVIVTQYYDRNVGQRLREADTVEPSVPSAQYSMQKLLLQASSSAARMARTTRTARTALAVAPRRQWLSTSPPNAVDRELQGSYEGLLPRLMTLQTLLDKKARGTLFDLHKNGVVPQESPLIALAIFADLQNPLLKKYKFDAAEFVVGAKEAFRQVHMAIASADFFNFSNGFASDQGSDKLLQESLHPKLYAACREACVEMHEKNVQTHMQAIKVSPTLTSV